MENFHIGQIGQHVPNNVIQEYEIDIDHVQIHHHHVEANNVKEVQKIYKYAIRNLVVNKLIF
jgi:hypothetical protein